MKFLVKYYLMKIKLAIISNSSKKYYLIMKNLNHIIMIINQEKVLNNSHNVERDESNINEEIGII